MDKKLVEELLSCSISCKDIWNGKTFYEVENEMTWIDW